MKPYATVLFYPTYSENFLNTSNQSASGKEIPILKQFLISQKALSIDNLSNFCKLVRLNTEYKPKSLYFSSNYAFMHNFLSYRC